MDKIRTAVIGYGKVAHLHAAALRGLPMSDFVAVCGRNIERAQSFADQYGLHAFTRVDEMIAQAGVQAVVICTPHPAHAGPAVEAARHGAHVLVEKPLASSLADCDAMIAAADASGVKLGVISQRRFYEPVRRVRQAIDSGKLGRPILGSAVMYSWRDENYYRSDPWRGQWEAEGGGVLVNQAPHQLDLLQWFMGPIDELFGYWDNLNHPYIEVEDTAVAVIRFKNGGLGSIVVSNSQKPGIYGKIHVHGSNGSTVGVQPEGGAMFIAGMTSVLEPPINDLWTIPGEEHLLAQWQAEDRAAFERVDATTHYITLQNEDFLQAIIEDRPPAVTGRDGRVTVEIFTAIYRSQRDRVPVHFPVDAVSGSEQYDGRLVPAPGPARADQTPEA
ncbi:MAG: Gfo/Idh/MocA family oxidoreductase [Chloroflexi bacterium]|nr:Gfo/Idh/MocA family oxidoreductase [Chloroflexota bacterium]